MRDSIFPTKPRPTAIPEKDQRNLLTHTRKQADGRRDAVLFTLALGTGLRLQEILALNVGDVRTASGGIRDRVRIRAEIAKRGSQGDALSGAAGRRRWDSPHPWARADSGSAGTTSSCVPPQ